jgi:hypothetical protein
MAIGTKLDDAPVSINASTSLPSTIILSIGLGEMALTSPNLVFLNGQFGNR